MNTLYLYWFKLTDGNANFGDEIGPYIVTKLSGSNVAFILPNKNFFF